MPTFDVVRTPLGEADVDMVAVPAFASPELADDEDDRQGQPPPPVLGPSAEDLGETLDIDLVGELRALYFDATTGSVARLPTRGAIDAPTVLAVGLGKETDVDREVLREAGAALADATSTTSSVATTIPAGVAALAEGADTGADEPGDGDPLSADVTARAFVEGMSLAAYRYVAYKSGDDGHELERVQLHGTAATAADELETGTRSGRIRSRATLVARDLVNQPPGDKRPPVLAERIRDDLGDSAIDVEVLDEDALADGGFDGVLAVGKGSEVPPRVVTLDYAPDGAEEHVALVGKGITFDSGGLSLKSGKGMMTMKMDMGGAAAVYGAVRGAAELELPVAITGVMAFAENMPSASAQRPGDVYTSRGGTTVEVLNTDAEGRLVLSDALAYAGERSPDVLIEMSTLTGAVVVALGREIGGLMTEHDDLAGALVAAGERSGEPLWRLPLPARYRDHLDSDVADIKNIGKSRQAGTVVAGLFLDTFVDDNIPWAHLDIAGLAWSESNSGYVRKGGTGAPVRTLLTWLSGNERQRHG